MYKDTKRTTIKGSLGFHPQQGYVVDVDGELVSLNNVLEGYNGLDISIAISHEDKIID